jgi:hypothetical protein
MTTIIMVVMMVKIRITKFKISLSRRVKPVFGVLVNFAIFPKTVESPVDTTTPIPLPDMQ